MIMIMMFWWKLLLRIQEYMFAPCAKWYSWFTCHVNGTRHSYKLRRSDGGPKYEIWLWVMKSYSELHFRLLQSYRLRRLLDIPNNFKVIRNKCEHQRRHQDRFVAKNVSNKFKRLTEYVAMLESMGYTLWLIQIVINTMSSSNPAFE